jgi:hypothetical protein
VAVFSVVDLVACDQARVEAAQREIAALLVRLDREMAAPGLHMVSCQAELARTLLSRAMLAGFALGRAHGRAEATTPNPN